MNLSLTHALCWLVSTGSLGLLSAAGYDFARSTEAGEAPGDPTRVARLLRSPGRSRPEPPARTSRGDVERLFVHLDWTGAPESPVTGTGPVSADPFPGLPPVASSLRILLIQVDPSNPAESRVFVRYPSLAGAPEDLLAVGDTLSQYPATRVHAIHIDRVEFGFDDARPIEIVATDTLAIRPQIVRVGPGRVRYPVELVPRETAPRFESADARSIRYQLGPEDARHAAEHYARLLSQELRARPWVDPARGRPGGVQLQDVPPGSIAERYGLRPGDVVSSVNGQAIASQFEIVNLVRRAAGTCTAWRVVVRNAGHERTLLLERPSVPRLCATPDRR